MKHFAFITTLAGALALAPVQAQVAPDTKAPPATGVPAIVANVGEPDKAFAEKHAKAALKGLSFADPAKEAQVTEILTAHYQAFKTWHEQHDAEIKTLWNDFNKARATKDGAKPDETKADAVLAQIDGVYASFKPEHDALFANLSPLLTPEQIEMIKDTLTVNKVKVTYNAYQQIFHGLTAEQNAFILKNLKAAREEAIDAAEIKKEGSAFFKKYKIKIETYLTAQGYDVKQSYVDFVAKQKAESPAKPAPAEKAAE